MYRFAIMTRCITYIISSVSQPISRKSIGLQAFHSDPRRAVVSDAKCVAEEEKLVPWETTVYLISNWARWLKFIIWLGFSGNFVLELVDYKRKTRDVCRWVKKRKELIEISNQQQPSPSASFQIWRKLKIYGSKDEYNDEIERELMSSLMKVKSQKT